MLEREVNVYPLAESELNQVAAANSLATMFFSGTTAFASIAASFWVAGETAGDEVSPRADAVFDVVPILAGAFAAILLIAFVVAAKSGRSVLTKLKNECRRTGEESSSDPEDIRN